MEHLAIMKKSWGLTRKILGGQKKIESRWYLSKRKPWDGIKIGETIYFKDSGDPVSLRAEVAKVLQFEIQGLNDATKIVKEYGKQICLINRNPRTWGKLPKYCILIFLKNPASVKPFKINKNGFGMMAAWISVKNISEIKLM